MSRSWQYLTRIPLRFSAPLATTLLLFGWLWLVPPTAGAQEDSSTTTTVEDSSGPVLDLGPQPELDESDDPEELEPEITTTTQIVCDSFGEVSTGADAVFIGTITGINESNNSITYRVVERESGGIQNPVTVRYVDDRPAIGLGEQARVRVTYNNDAEVLSNITCGATTDLDDKFLDAAVDPLSAIGASAGEVASRVGRYLLIGGLIVLGATAVLTFLRRMWPLVV